MMINRFSLFIILSFLIFWLCQASVVSIHNDVSPDEKNNVHNQHAPEVAFNCGYRNQFLDQVAGDWVTDKDIHATCLKGKLDILKYCRKVYPTLQINNIVESDHLITINNWCEEKDGKLCKWSFPTRPYRCLVGEFESEALLVPRGCHFGHVENRTQCHNFSFWNTSAQIECSKRMGDLHVDSFAMLEPCGLDMFSGVEFVCCPNKQAQPEDNSLRVSVHLEPDATLGGKSLSAKDNLKNKSFDVSDFDLGIDDDDDDDEDDDEDSEAADDDIASKVTPKSSSTSVRTSKRLKTTTTLSYQTASTDDSDVDDDDDDESEESSKGVDKKSEDLLDVYFKVADPEYEHERYHEALDRLERKHKNKISAVMKEWSELESRYEAMLTRDPNHAQVFRHEMVLRFNKTVTALEAERKEQKHQIEQVHEQRVEATLNERKREIVRKFREALSQKTPSYDKIVKTLQSYIKVEEKERFHLLNRYKHLLRSDVAEAENVRPNVLHKLNDIDLRIKGNIALVTQLKSQLADKIKMSAFNFWHKYRIQNTPDVQDGALLRVDHVDNDRLLEWYKNLYEVKHTAENAQSEANKIAVDAIKATTRTTTSASTPNSLQAKKEKVAEEPIINSPIDAARGGNAGSTISPEIIVFDPVVEIAGGDDNRLKEEKILDEYRPFGAYAKHNILQHESTIIERNMYDERVSGYSFLVVGLAGAALMACLIVGVVLVRRRSFHHRQGFVEVDACTPEERHVNSMQGNGYENPTYKYFEEKI